MEFIVLLIACIGLLTALSSRKRGQSLQLQINGVLARLTRLQDELEDLRRGGPQAPIPEAAPPAPGMPEVRAAAAPLPPEDAEASAQGGAPPSVPEVAPTPAPAPARPSLEERLG